MFQPEKECQSKTMFQSRTATVRQSLFEQPVAKPLRRFQALPQSLRRAETENTRLLPVGILARWLAPESRTMQVQPPTRRRSGENRSCNEARSEDRAAGWRPFCRASLSYYRQFLTANSSM